MRIVAHSRSVNVPEGWEARIFRRGGAEPVLHVASFALHDGDGDFGASATARMRPDDIFAALLEYRTDSKLKAGRGLFARAGRPEAPRASELAPNKLQVPRRGQIGCQRFFTYAERPFCLFVVVRPAREHPQRLLSSLGHVLDTFELHP
jgi:hypothetical protein